jgi:glycosyltransferase involved in cell wall biosynthesis
VLAPPPAGSVVPGQRPTFSVAIAAYQAAETVGAAVESALSQTLPPLEVVICDDGSTDDFVGAIAPFRDRVVVLRQENRGEAAAKNAAAAAATGEFVAFLDADDLYYPERLEALAELASSRPDLDVLTTNADLEVAGRVVGRYYPDVATFPVEDQASGVIANDSAVFGAAAVRASSFAAAGGLPVELRSTDDWELWIRLLLAGSKIGLVDEPLYRYRLHERGTSADQAEGLKDCVRVLERVLGDATPAPAERAALERSLAYHRRAAMLTEAEAALRAGPRQGRASSRLVATSSEFSAGTRLKAALAVALPRTVARLLAWRERRTGRSRIRKPMPDR